MTGVEMARDWASNVGEENAEAWERVITWYTNLTRSPNFDHALALIKETGADTTPIVAGYFPSVWGELPVPEPDWLHKVELGLIAVIEALHRRNIK